MKIRELLMKPWSCVVPVDGWINGPVAAPQCRDDSSLAPTNHCGLCHTVDTGQLHNWNFNQCSVDLAHKQLDYFSQIVCKGLDINFLRRLSEPWFHLLMYQFPNALIFENGQPTCEVVWRPNQDAFDKWTTFNAKPWVSVSNFVAELKSGFFCMFNIDQEPSSLIGSGVVTVDVAKPMIQNI